MVHPSPWKLILLELIYPEDQEAVKHAWNSSIKGHAETMKHRLAAFGSLKWVEERTEVEKDLNDQIIGILGTIQDITDKVNTIRELVTYRSHLEDLVAARTADLNALNEEQNAIFNAATTGILLILNHIIFRCNKRLEEVLGYEPNELIGWNCANLFDSEAEYNDLNLNVHRAGGRHRRP